MEPAAQMTEPAPSDHRSNPARQILGIGMLMLAMYLCARSLRFSNNWFNLAFEYLFFLLPFVAARYALRLRGWAGFAAGVVIVPLLFFSLFILFLIAIADVPAEVEHRQLSRSLGTAQQGRYTVHLAWDETAGGALGPHGVSLEQRMNLLPGLYAFKPLDWFDDAREGSLSAIGPDRIEVHIPGTRFHPGVDRVYSLKPWLYF